MATSSLAREHCRKYYLAEIRSGTRYFSDRLIIGEGGFGKVYKCFIKKGTIVAVKRLDKKSGQGGPEFDKEIETLTEIRHRNIVSLFGYCDEKKEKILVYEFISNRTLADHLHRLPSNGHPSLTWHQRFTVLIGAARGLDYLHYGIPGSSIIHRDVKSSNILLDGNFEAKVSDFGLAKHLGVDNPQSHVWTSVKGSRGYYDPCFVRTGKLTRASDTFAFGVMVLEVLSGRLPLDKKRPEDEWLLSDWASKKQAHQIVASKVSGYISESSLNICFEVAKRCLHNEPKERPKMTQVLALLESALEGLSPNPPRIILSGSTQEDHNQVEFSRMLEPIEEDALEYEQDVVMPPVAGLGTPVDESEDRQNANMLLEDIPAIQEDALEHEQITVPFIPLAKLQEMTEGFSRMHWIANGSTGGSTVFRGVVRRTGEGVAIKRL